MASGVLDKGAFEGVGSPGTGRRVLQQSRITTPNRGRVAATAARISERKRPFCPPSPEAVVYVP